MVAKFIYNDLLEDDYDHKKAIELIIEIYSSLDDGKFLKNVHKELGLNFNYEELKNQLFGEI